MIVNSCIVVGELAAASVKDRVLLRRNGRVVYRWILMWLLLPGFVDNSRLLCAGASSRHQQNLRALGAVRRRSAWLWHPWHRRWIRGLAANAWICIGCETKRQGRRSQRVMLLRFFGLPRRLLCSVPLLGGGAERNFWYIAFRGFSFGEKKREFSVFRSKLWSNLSQCPFLALGKLQLQKKGFVGWNFVVIGRWVIHSFQVCSFFRSWQLSTGVGWIS